MRLEFDHLLRLGRLGVTQRDQAAKISEAPVKLMAGAKRNMKQRTRASVVEGPTQTDGGRRNCAVNCLFVFRKLLKNNSSSPRTSTDYLSFEAYM